jgi:hypothetical protein
LLIFIELSIDNIEYFAIMFLGIAIWQLSLEAEMNVPWFASTDEAARLVLRAGESDYRQFIEKTQYSIDADSAGAWYHAALALFANLFNTKKKAAKKSTVPAAGASLQPR